MSCVHPSLTSQKMGGDGYRPSFVALITALVRKRWKRQRRESKIGGNRGSLSLTSALPYSRPLGAGEPLVQPGNSHCPPEADGAGAPRW